ncbi:MAG: hypothetical protein GSR85_09510 [Desulfurococcales archaeon]|nr:hypothetical protein [Desulfurococcales archaeon]
MKSLKISIYAGFDWRSRLSAKVAREAAIIIAKTYGIPVEVEVIDVPVGDIDAEEHGIPLVLVNERQVSSGSIPSIVSLIDSAFEEIERELGPSVLDMGLGYPSEDVYGITGI